MYYMLYIILYCARASARGVDALDHGDGTVSTLYLDLDEA